MNHVEAPVCLPFEAIASVRGTRCVPPVFDFLWVEGSLDGLAQPAVAIVGTRAASAYGKALARRFALDLGMAGCSIVSGLALGIDTAAHEGALEARAATIGVLGGGHERLFPLRNSDLARRILQSNGAVLSPYPPEHPALPHQFLERNGVVAALSDAVVVIEAPERSGALNTAGWAAGRIPVFAVPGDVDRKHVAGCHALIRDGAILARSARDILDDLHLSGAFAPTPSAPAKKELHWDPVCQTILDTLDIGEATLEELLARSTAAAPAVFAALSYLEVGGAIEARPGQRYARR